MSAVVLATFGGLVPATATENTAPEEEVRETIEQVEQELEDEEVWEAPAEVERDASGGEPEGEWGEQPAEELPEAPEERFSRQAEDDPASEIEAPDMFGVLPYYPLHTIELFANTTAGVNMATGNLVIGSTQVELSSAGVPAVYTDHYNSRDTTPGSFGGGWRSGIGQDTGVRFTNGDNSELLFRDASGFNQYFTKDDDGDWQSPAGLNATLSRTEGNGFLIEYHRTGQRMHFNSGGYLMESTDRNDVGVEFGYNGRKVSSVTDPAGRVTEISYEDDGDTIIYTTPDQQREIIYTREDNKLASVEYRVENPGTPMVQKTYYSYNGDNQLEQLRAEFGNTDTEIALDIAYDDYRVESLTQRQFTRTGDAVSNERERTTSFAYSSGQTVVTDRDGEESTFSIDDQGRVIEATDQLGRTRSQEWSANSDVVSATSPATGGSSAGDVSVYEYDEAGNRTGVELPTGAAATAAYQIGDSCDNGGSGTAYQVKCSTDMEGNEATYEYDSAGNLLSATDETGGIESFSHSREDEDRSVCNAFEGMICETTNGTGETTSYQYNDNGDLISIDQPVLGTTTIKYDSISRPVEVSAPDGTVYNYAYSVGQDYGPVRITRDGESTTLRNTHVRHNTAAPYTYRDTSWEDFVLSRPEGDGIYGDSARERFYQSTGTSSYALLRLPQNNDNGMPVETDTRFAGIGWNPIVARSRESYSYDAASQMEHMKLPGAGSDSCSTEDPAGDRGKCVAFEYDSRGNPTQQVFPGGAVKETTYDASSRPTRITVTDASDETVFDVEYSYTDAEDADRGLIQSKTSHVEEGVPAGAVTTYQYDSLNRLIEAEERDGDEVNASWEYSYDEAGNRTQSTSSGDTGRDSEDISYTYDANNQLATIDGDDVSHDEAGNLTSNPATGLEATYGARQNAETFTLDGETTEALTWGQGNSYRREFNDTVELRSELGLQRIANPEDPLEGTTYARDPRGGGIIAATPTDADTPVEDGDSTFYVTDHLGSIVVLLDEDGEKVGGYSYDPYGQERVVTEGAAEENLFRYVGAQYDLETELYKMGHRYYDPTTGRFTQPDPSGAEDTQYTYAAGNPANYLDPTGLSTVNSCGPLALSIAGTVISAPTGPVGWSLAGTANAWSAAACIDSFGTPSDAWTPNGPAGSTNRPNEGCLVNPSTGAASC